MKDILDQMIEAAMMPGNELACACGGNAVETMVLERVPIGEKGDSFEVRIPILECQSCGLKFRDERAEEQRQSAAAKHLGLLSPQEVKGIREHFGMSRRAFSEAFDVPPASMERWENGRLLQNKLNDNFLRSLLIPGVAEAILKRKRIPRFVVGSAEDNVIHVNFPALASLQDLEKEAVLQRESVFDLRTHGVG